MNMRIIFSSVLIVNLISSFANPMTQSQTQNILLQAIKNDSAPEVIQTIESVIMQGKDGKSPIICTLLKAIMSGTAEEIKKAVQPVLEQGKFDKSPMTWAVLLKKPNAVEALVECGAKVDADIIKFALTMRDFKTIISLIRNGVEIFNYTDDYIKIAVQFINAPTTSAMGEELIQELVKRRCNINKAWEFLHGNSRPESFNCLIKNGANPNHIWSHGNSKISNTPLVNAILSNNKPAVQILLNAGADMNQQASPLSHAPDLQGPRTSLYFAAMHGFTEIVALLLERGAKL